MNISGILAQKGRSVATIEQGASVQEAARVLERHGVGALVVSADGERVEGILSERDLARAVARHGASALELRVADLMTREVVVCRPTDSVISLMPLMTDRRIRHVPVLDDGRLCGIVSIGDVVKWRMDELETEARTLHDYLTSGR